MGQLSDKDLQVIHQLAPLWKSIQPLWWRNPLDYRLELISQPTPSFPDAPATCAIQGCRYALYRPGVADAFAYCTSHRDATLVVVTDALTLHRQQELAVVG